MGVPVYPTDVKSFTTKVDGVDTVVAAHVNTLQDEVVGIQTHVGTVSELPDVVTPGGSSIAKRVGPQINGLKQWVDTLNSNKAPITSPTFSGAVSLPSTTSIGNVSSTELGYLDGVTSGIQAQLNSKVGSASPTLTTPTLSNATMTGTTTINGTPVLGTAVSYPDDAFSTSRVASVGYVNEASGSNTMWQSGAQGFRVVGGTIAASPYLSVLNITFPSTAFAGVGGSKPSVVVSNGHTDAWIGSVGVYSPNTGYLSTEGVTVQLFQGGTAVNPASVRVNWIAMGV